MEIDEANANREKRIEKTRAFLREAGLLEVVDEFNAAFQVRIDWVKYGDRILGRDAYERSVDEAKRYQARVREHESEAHKRSVAGK